MSVFQKLSSVFLIISFVFLVGSCKEEGPSSDGSSNDLASLPEDTGGDHIAEVLGSTAAAYGYYIYLPGGYEDANANYPIMIFLHGKSERGDGSSNPEVLDRVLKNGPPKMIENQLWITEHPMIVVSPQYHGSTGNANNWGAGDENNLKGFIEYLIDNYKINEKRIYLTGMSHGGNGVYDYITNVPDSVSYLAAAAPVAAYGAGRGFEKAQNTPVWVFVGENDATNMKTSKNFVEKYNEQNPSPTHAAKITIFEDAGHNVWTRTYSGDGMGSADPDYSPFDMSLYDWMFQFERED
ncbi:Dienelactone hydrolase family protein [Marivirga sericea]|uniref:Dienelactone hydrolase family protein n=1 Tax=Marivirga sericea TaxID=1028 RepID=A0A1X7JIV6_9BACT|nr:dienelactone hydrolase family protein [Marivirga sericea]SMG27779.1 Dienelactone hydrolase family protein [Marivirga sericea]